MQYDFCHGLLLQGDYDMLIDTDYVAVKAHQGKNNKINIINLNNNKDIYLFYIFVIGLIF